MHTFKDVAMHLKVHVTVEIAMRTKQQVTVAKHKYVRKCLDANIH